MRLSGTVTKADFNNYLWITVRRVMGGRRLWLPAFAPLIIAITAAPATRLLTGSPISAESVELVMSGMFAGWAVGALWTYLTRCVPAPEYVTNTGAFLGPKEISLEDHHYVVKSPGQTGKVELAKILDVMDRNGTVTLMLDKSYGEVIPANAFSSPEEARAFCKDLKQRLSIS